MLGHADFYGLRLSVSPDVLIPRPETEELVEEALRRIAGVEAPTVLDVGTGSGAVALALAHERPTATVFAADVSAEALAVARANAERLGLDVAFVRADALGPHFTRDVPPAFDLVVSNPPYVPAGERAGLQPEVRDWEPGLALFVPDADPLRFYRALAGHAGALLAPRRLARLRRRTPTTAPRRATSSPTSASPRRRSCRTSPGATGSPSAAGPERRARPPRRMPKRAREGGRVEPKRYAAPGPAPRPVFSCSSSIFVDASALLKSLYCSGSSPGLLRERVEVRLLGASHRLVAGRPVGGVLDGRGVVLVFWGRHREKGRVEGRECR